MKPNATHRYTKRCPTAGRSAGSRRHAIHKLCPENACKLRTTRCCERVSRAQSSFVCVVRTWRARALLSPGSEPVLRICMYSDRGTCTHTQTGAAPPFVSRVTTKVGTLCEVQRTSSVCSGICVVMSLLLCLCGFERSVNIYMNIVYTIYYPGP